MRRRGFMFAAIAALMTLGACSGGGDTAASEGASLTPAEEARVCRQAREDVARVNAASAGSMEREGAILEIRAKEQSLRLGGYNAAADLYVEVSDSLLRAGGAI